MTLFGTWKQRAILAILTATFTLVTSSRFNRKPAIAIVQTSPANFAVGVAPNAHSSITFSNEMNSATITPASVQLLDDRQTVVPTRLSYNPYNRTVTLDSLKPLAYDKTYELRLKQGVRDESGNAIEDMFTTTFATARSPLTGPGGPILVVTNPQNPFSTYYPEILRAEGFNEFSVADLSDISPATLSKFQLVILGDLPLNDSQVSAFSAWVNNGGKLIAMHPDSKLSNLLGLSDIRTSVADGYLAVDRTNTIGAGIIGAAIQYHGQAERFTIKSAHQLALLQADASTPLANPAVTLHEVGKNGGMAAAFAFDLAKSVVLIRQGNPAWAGQHRTGEEWGAWTQSADLFCGPAKFDPQKNWVDMKNIAIPQADEQQRLLANMIVWMNLASSPLPRFAYFPDGVRALVILTGDDHDLGGTASRFRQVRDAATSGGLPMAATSYLFPGPANADSISAFYAAQGFEIGLHSEVTQGALFGSPSDVPSDWLSESQLDDLYASEQFAFDSTYPSLPSPRTARIHGPVWSDYDSLPQVEFAHGVRLDTSYYFAPPHWVNDQPGFFTGSGIPMRFATAAGNMIDVYQAATQVTDESGQSEPRTIDTLLDNATSDKEFFGAFTINAHTDDETNPLADVVIASAKEHDVPIISAENLLNFEDGRGSSTFSDIAWNASIHTLTFAINKASGASHLQVMIPLKNALNEKVTTLKLNSQSIPFHAAIFNGIQYAVFAADNGTLTAIYSKRSCQ
jgi:hypothetical protein